MRSDNRSWSEYIAAWRQDNPIRTREIGRKASANFKLRVGKEALRSRYRKYHRSEAGRFGNAKSAAKRRDIPWCLTKIEYRSLLENSCVYCTGDLPPTGFGLDRIDNSRGYEVGNVLPCCTACNRLRGDFLTVEETMMVVQYIKKLRSN